MNGIVKAVTESIVKDFGSYAVSQFVDVLNKADPALLDELEKTLSRYKQCRDKPKD